MATSGKQVMQWYRFMFLTDLYAFLLPSSRVLRDPTHAVQVIYADERTLYFLCKRCVDEVGLGGGGDKFKFRLGRQNIFERALHTCY